MLASSNRHHRVRTLWFVHLCGWACACKEGKSCYGLEVWRKSLRQLCLSAIDGHVTCPLPSLSTGRPLDEAFETSSVRLADLEKLHMVAVQVGSGERACARAHMDASH